MPEDNVPVICGKCRKKCENVKAFFSHLAPITDIEDFRAQLIGIGEEGLRIIAHTGDCQEA